VSVMGCALLMLDFRFWWRRVWSLRVFWGVLLGSQVDVDWHFRGAYCLHHCPDDGDSMHL
jgi:hypothetical protein